MDLELKDDGNPVCLRPYPVPRVHEAMFRKEAKRILKLGVLKEEMTQNRNHFLLPIQMQK